MAYHKQQQHEPHDGEATASMTTASHEQQHDWSHQSPKQSRDDRKSKNVTASSHDAESSSSSSSPVTTTVAPPLSPFGEEEKSFNRRGSWASSPFRSYYSEAIGRKSNLNGNKTTDEVEQDLNKSLSNLPMAAASSAATSQSERTERSTAKDLFLLDDFLGGNDDDGPAKQTAVASVKTDDAVIAFNSSFSSLPHFDAPTTTTTKTTKQAFSSLPEFETTTRTANDKNDDEDDNDMSLREDDLFAPAGAAKCGKNDKESKDNTSSFSGMAFHSSYNCLPTASLDHHRSEHGGRRRTGESLADRRRMLSSSSHDKNQDKNSLQSALTTFRGQSQRNLLATKQPNQRYMPNETKKDPIQFMSSTDIAKNSSHNKSKSSSKKPAAAAQDRRSLLRKSQSLCMRKHADSARAKYQRASNRNLLSQDKQDDDAEEDPLSLNRSRHGNKRNNRSLQRKISSLKASSKHGDPRAQDMAMQPKHTSAINADEQTVAAFHSSFSTPPDFEAAAASTAMSSSLDLFSSQVLAENSIDDDGNLLDGSFSAFPSAGPAPSAALKKPTTRGRNVQGKKSDSIQCMSSPESASSCATRSTVATTSSSGTASDDSGTTPRQRSPQGNIKVNSNKDASPPGKEEKEASPLDSLMQRSLATKGGESRHDLLGRSKSEGVLTDEEGERETMRISKCSLLTPTAAQNNKNHQDWTTEGMNDEEIQLWLGKSSSHNGPLAPSHLDKRTVRQSVRTERNNKNSKDIVAEDPNPPSPQRRTTSAPSVEEPKVLSPRRRTQSVRGHRPRCRTPPRRSHNESRFPRRRLGSHPSGGEQRNPAPQSSNTPAGKTSNTPAGPTSNTNHDSEKSKDQRRGPSHPKTGERQTTNKGASTGPQRPLSVRDLRRSCSADYAKPSHGKGGETTEQQLRASTGSTNVRVQRARLGRSTSEGERAKSAQNTTTTKADRKDPPGRSDSPENANKQQQERQPQQKRGRSRVSRSDTDKVRSNADKSEQKAKSRTTALDVRSSHDRSLSRSRRAGGDDLSCSLHDPRDRSRSRSKSARARPRTVDGGSSISSSLHVPGSLTSSLSSSSLQGPQSASFYPSILGMDNTNNGNDNSMNDIIGMEHSQREVDGGNTAGQSKDRSHNGADTSRPARNKDEKGDLAEEEKRSRSMSRSRRGRRST